MSWIKSDKEDKEIYTLTVVDEGNIETPEVDLVIGGRNELYRTLLSIDSHGLAKGRPSINPEFIYNEATQGQQYQLRISFRENREFYLRNKDLVSSNNYLWCNGHGMGGYTFSVKKCTGYGATKFKQSDLKHIPKGILDRCEKEYIEVEDK